MNGNHIVDELNYCICQSVPALFVNPIFDNYRDYDGLAILGVLAYSAQLYGDFSGAMDIVIGIAQMFGIKMDENFQRPYFSISITDFWHRWHITLGTWMKDYLFYPLKLFVIFSFYCTKIFMGVKSSLILFSYSTPA